MGTNTNNKNNQGARKIVVFIFFFFYLMFPDYFALEFSESLPLLTASRILILLLMIFTFVIDHSKIYTHQLEKEYYVFMALLLLVNIVDISSLPGESIKTILSLLLESWLLLYLIKRVINNIKLLNYAITAMVIASALIGILGGVETLTGTNVFYYLTTTQRDMLQSAYVRFSAVRASGPFGHAVYFGAYCVCMIPFSLYLYDTRKKGIYFIIFLINIISVILSGSRGQIAIMAALLLYILYKKQSKYNFRYLKNLIAFIPVIALVLIMFPDFRERIGDILQSTIDAFTLYSSYSSRADSTIGNANGILSRTEQWSGIVWTIIQGRALFGFGNRAHQAFLIKYFRNGEWVRTSTFDVGYVAYFCQYGLIGLIGYLYMFYWRLKDSWNIIKELKKISQAGAWSSSLENQQNLQITFVIFFVCYLANLLTCTGVDKLLFVMIGLQITSISILKKDELYEVVK